jgi:hypothetical protein
MEVLMSIPATPIPAPLLGGAPGEVFMSSSIAACAPDVERKITRDLCEVLSQIEKPEPKRMASRERWS